MSNYSDNESEEYDIFENGKDFEKINDIDKRYTIGPIIGMGTFGIVKKASMK